MSGRRGFSLGCILAASTLVVSNPTAHAQLQGEAIPGAPFGIARVTVPLTARDRALYETRGYELFEENGRTLYPAFTSGAANRILGDLVGEDSGQPPNSLTALFLFTGSEPLKVSFVTSKVHTATIVPRPQRQLAFNRMLRSWWREYHAAARQRASEGDYPPLMDTYLTSMLSSRLGFQPPLLSRIGQEKPDELKQTLQLLFGVEKLRAATMRDTMLRQGGFGEAADRPVPRDVAWSPPAEIVADADVDIEPMAMHVPEECFYVRFGKFSNYLWLDHLMKDYGGDISRMINLRGHDARLNRRMQDQLVLEQTKLSELFGGQVIADIAMIGRDMYMREGAAIGILFQSKNNLLFGNDMRSRRKTAQKLHEKDGATLETVKIDGHDVSFLSTPDNRLRSFYAVDGDFHLVTTSKAIVKRFYEAGAGERSLGGSAEFRHARTIMPTSREDTIFAYISSAFFRGLISPQYQIELTRRIQSVTDMELLQMAKLAARAEGVPGDTIDDLVAAKLLPAGFGRRPDGSGPILNDHGMFDSLRGARGSFTPVPDVELRGVSRTEESRYASRAAYYRDNWKQMDPLVVGVKRYALKEKGQERVVIDANVSPFGAEKYGWITSLLGPPTKERITTAPGDIISVQASVKGGLLLPSVPPHYLFARVQDVAPPETDLKPTGFFKTLQILQTTPGYLGAWPKPGFLDMLPFKIGGDPDINGFSPLPFGVWRWQGGGFSNFSFDQRMLAHVAPHLKPEPTEDPAQIRIQVGDVAHSKLAGWVSSLTYARATQTSVGNVRMLHNLTQQFHVPREEALTTAERLLDVKLMCSLGGKYEPVSPDTGVAYWTSNKYPAGPSYVRPEDYQSPLLAWFRGLNAGLTQSGDRMILHAELDMQRKASDAGLKLPSFDLFGPKKPDKQEADKDKPEVVDPPKKPAPREF